MRTTNKTTGVDLEKTIDEHNSQFTEPKLLQVIPLAKMLYAEYEEEGEIGEMPVYCLGLCEYRNREQRIVPLFIMIRDMNDILSLENYEAMFKKDTIYNFVDPIKVVKTIRDRLWHIVAADQFCENRTYHLGTMVTMEQKVKLYNQLRDEGYIQNPNKTRALATISDYLGEYGYSKTHNKTTGVDLEKTIDEHNSQFTEPKLLQVIPLPKVQYAEIEQDKEKFYYPVYCLGLYKYGNDEPLVVPIVFNYEYFENIEGLFGRNEAAIYNLVDHIPELEK